MESLNQTHDKWGHIIYIHCIYCVIPVRIYIGIEIIHELGMSWNPN